MRKDAERCGNNRKISAFLQKRRCYFVKLQHATPSNYVFLLPPFFITQQKHIAWRFNNIDFANAMVTLRKYHVYSSQMACLRIANGMFTIFK